MNNHIKGQDTNYWGYCFSLEQTPRNVELVTLLDSLVEGHLSGKDTYIRADLTSVCRKEHALLVSLMYLGSI